jgi:hypothetical protein
MNKTVILTVRWSQGRWGKKTRGKTRELEEWNGNKMLFHQNIQGGQNTCHAKLNIHHMLLFKSEKHQIKENLKMKQSVLIFFWLIYCKLHNKA